MVFPVAGRTSYSDTFGALRLADGTHQGQDLMAARHTPLVAAADSTVTSLTWSNSGLSGNSLTITDADGWRYVYIHLNNGAPGTDDGSNVYERAFADRIAKGQKVKAGVVGYVGDSGNAESTSPHLHFELRRPDGNRRQRLLVAASARTRGAHRRRTHRRLADRNARQRRRRSRNRQRRLGLDATTTTRSRSRSTWPAQPGRHRHRLGRPA